MEEKLLRRQPEDVYTDGSAGHPSRRRLLTAAGLALAGAVPAARLIGSGAASAAPSRAQDAKILQLVLQVEYTQVAFYEQALRQASLKGDLHEFAHAVLAHERAHLSAVKSALGSAAGPAPRHFAFGARTRSPAAFVRSAIALEDAAVAGYNGQAANLTTPTLAVAAEIVSVEARHAAWVRAIAGEVAAPEPVDQPFTAQRVAATLRAFGMKP
jgi:rubrerythrin